MPLFYSYLSTCLNVANLAGGLNYHLFTMEYFILIELLPANHCISAIICLKLLNSTISLVELISILCISHENVVKTFILSTVG